jgi:hypothetical protein
MKLIVRTAIAICVLAGLWPASMAAQSALAPVTYYISASLGNDRNAGTTPAEAWQHLNMIYLKSISSKPFQQGDRILLKRGDTWYGQIRMQADGTAEYPIVIGDYGEGQKPLLYGDDQEKWEPVAGYAGVFTLDMGTGSAVGVYVDGKSLRAIYPHGSLKSNENMQAFLSALTKSVVGEYEGRLWLRTDEGELPAGRVRCFRAAGVSLSASSYVRIENLDLRRFSTGIDVENSRRIEIRHNNIQDVLGIGIYLRSKDFDCLVESNTVFRAGNTALYVLKGVHNTFRDNWVSHVDSMILGIAVRGDAMGIGLQESAQTLVENNYFSDSGGIDFYYEQGSTVRYNYLERVSSAGAPHGVNLTIEGNSYNLSGPGGEPGSKGVNAVATGPGTITVSNNTIFNALNFFFKGSASNGGNVVFHDNVAAARVVGATFDDFAVGVTSAHNCFSSPGDPIFRYHNQIFNSLPAYQAGSSLEPASVFSTELSSEPTFVDQNHSSPLDFRILKNSACTSSRSKSTLQRPTKVANRNLKALTCRSHCFNHAFNVTDGVYEVRMTFSEDATSNHEAKFSFLLNGRRMEVVFEPAEFSNADRNAVRWFLIRPQDGTITVEPQAGAEAVAVTAVDILLFDESHGEGLQVIPW